MRSKVCIALIHVRSKVCKFANLDGSNADFAPHMEGSHVDFAPHMKRRHSFRDHIVDKIASFADLQRKLVKTNNIFMPNISKTYVTTFETKNILREITFKVNINMYYP